MKPPRQVDTAIARAYFRFALAASTRFFSAANRSCAVSKHSSDFADRKHTDLRAWSLCLHRLQQVMWQQLQPQQEQQRWRAQQLLSLVVCPRRQWRCVALRQSLAHNQHQQALRLGLCQRQRQADRLANRPYHQLATSPWAMQLLTSLPSLCSLAAHAPGN